MVEIALAEADPCAAGEEGRVEVGREVSLPPPPNPLLLLILCDEASVDGTASELTLARINRPINNMIMELHV